MTGPSDSLANISDRLSSSGGLSRVTVDAPLSLRGSRGDEGPADTASGSCVKMWFAGRIRRGTREEPVGFEPCSEERPEIGATGRGVNVVFVDCWKF